MTQETKTNHNQREIETKAKQIKDLTDPFQEGLEPKDHAYHRYLQVLVTALLEENAYDEIKFKLKKKTLKEAVINLIREMDWVDQNTSDRNIHAQILDVGSSVYKQINELTDGLNDLSATALASLSKM